MKKTFWLITGISIAFSLLVLIVKRIKKRKTANTLV